jgi:hypothetical protein
MLESLGSGLINRELVTFTKNSLINVPLTVIRHGRNRLPGLGPDQMPAYRLRNLPKHCTHGNRVSWVVFKGSIQLDTRGPGITVECDMAAYYKTAPPRLLGAQRALGVGTIASDRSPRLARGSRPGIRGKWPSLLLSHSG